MISQLGNGNSVAAESEYYFLKEKDLALEKPKIKTNISKSQDGYLIELITDKRVKDLYLSIDESGFFSDNYFDLIAIVTKSIDFKTQKTIDDFTAELKQLSLFDSYE